MSELKAAWGSTLSVAELAAVRSEGFDPVGQVMGSCVHQVYAYLQTSNLGGAWGGGGVIGGGIAGGVGIGGGFGYGSQGGRGGWGGPLGGSPFGAGQMGGGGIWSVQELSDYSQALRSARNLALERMSAEAAGSHGVVGVRLNLRWLDESARILEFTALGTAVRAAGREVSSAPFLSLLSGEEFAKLLRGGYVPCGVAMGISALAVAGSPVGNWAMMGPGYEVQEFSQAAARARTSAVSRMEEDLRRMGADGAVGSQVVARVQHQEGAGYPIRIVEFSAVGTAVMRFGRDDDPLDAVLGL
ncbi:MAG TPA: heavy metal-binding domain-containing protein [Candidatus Nitrosotalea sp.]|nr:heavy metal-binding domain-containing protein [Candidatus Nitrosotalea sp.]